MVLWTEGQQHERGGGGGVDLFAAFTRDIIRHLPHDARPIFAADARLLAFNPLAAACNVPLYAAHDGSHSTLELRRPAQLGLAQWSSRTAARPAIYMCRP